MRPIRSILLAAACLGALAAPAAAQEPAVDGADHRLFAGPTGRTLPGGTGSIGVIELFFPTVAYGFTDRVQLGAGTVVAPEVAGEIVWIEPRLGLVSRPGVELAVGAIGFFAGRALDEGSVGAVHATGTFGGERGAVTAGAAVPFYADPGEGDSEWIDRPILSLGGEMWLSRSVKLLTENHFVPADGTTYGVFTGGIRIVAGRLSADVGLAGATGDPGDGGCCLPIVNFAWALGGER